MTRRFLQILQFYTVFTRFQLDFRSDFRSARFARSAEGHIRSKTWRKSKRCDPCDPCDPCDEKNGIDPRVSGQVSRSGLGVGGRASWILTQQMCSFMPRDPLCLELRMFQDVSRCEFIMNMKKCKQSMGQSNLAKPIKILCNNVTSALENLLGDGRRTEEGRSLSLTARGRQK